MEDIKIKELYEINDKLQKALEIEGIKLIQTEGRVKTINKAIEFNWTRIKKLKQNNKMNNMIKNIIKDIEI